MNQATERQPSIASLMVTAQIAELRREKADLVRVLKDLRNELRIHIKFDVKKHYSLMVADAAAGTVLHKLGEDK